MRQKLTLMEQIRLAFVLNASTLCMPKRNDETAAPETGQVVERADPPPITDDDGNFKNIKYTDTKTLPPLNHQPITLDEINIEEEWENIRNINNISPYWDEPSHQIFNDTNQFCMPSKTYNNFRYPGDSDTYKIDTPLPTPKFSVEDFRRQALADHIRKGNTTEALAMITPGFPGDTPIGGIMDIQEDTTLHQAASYNRPSIAKKLLECGASVDAHNKYGYTPLMHAVITGGTDTMRVLIAAGADIDAKNGDTTIERYAHINKKDDVIQTLEDARIERRIAAIKKAEAAGAPKTRRILRRRPTATV